MLKLFSLQYTSKVSAKQPEKYEGYNFLHSYKVFRSAVTLTLSQSELSFAQFTIH